MEMNANVQERPEVAVEEGLSHQLIMRVLKLRWMGMENEAKRMQLALRRADAACTLRTGRFDAD